MASPERKYNTYLALQQSDNKRVESVAEISAFDPNMLIWIDKTGVMKLAYSLKGTPARTCQLHIGGERGW